MAAIVPRSVIAATGWGRIRFDVAYCVALFFAINAVDWLFFGGPQGSASQQALEWIGFGLFIMAPAALWQTRNTRAAPYLQDMFIMLTAAFIVVEVAGW